MSTPPNPPAAGAPAGETRVDCPTAASIAGAVRGGRETALGATEAALARIAATEPAVRAWQHLDPARALEVASRIDDGHGGLLAGVPVGVKDIIDTRDLPTENGTPIHAGRRPAEDATVVTRLRRAGAVVIGKTVTTEIACGRASKTRNPHDVTRTPGGSSSGSAATVAAGGAPLALGTQTAGSVNRPAAFCGVWAMKPSFGAIPRTGVLALSRSLDHVGVFGRGAEDLALAIDAISGDDGIDPDSEAIAPTRLAAALRAPLGRPALAFIRGPAWDEMEPAAAALYEETARALDAEPVDLGPAFADAIPVHRALMRREIAHHLGTRFAGAEDRLSETAEEHIRVGRSIGTEEYLSLLDAVRAMRAAFAAIMGRYAAALTAPAPGEAPEGLTFTGSRFHTLLWTLLGAPAVNVPGLAGPHGLPLGLQIVGARGADAETLRAAAWIAQALHPGDDRPHDGETAGTNR